MRLEITLTFYMQRAESLVNNKNRVKEGLNVQFVIFVKARYKIHLII